MTYEVKLIYGYEVNSNTEAGAITEAFIEHMRELNDNPRPSVDVTKLRE